MLCRLLSIIKLLVVDKTLSYIKKKYLFLSGLVLDLFELRMEKLLCQNY